MMNAPFCSPAIDANAHPERATSSSTASWRRRSSALAVASALAAAGAAAASAAADPTDKDDCRMEVAASEASS